ncbi:TfoX/Sxy family protein [Aeromicrobium alkaliterrae]|uniref:TfoX/Sxy family protein n=1 Tax=Aeromicrobium alkaliterrae TaxID=302168 RepID=A0ABP4VZU0_9ACTN
MSYDPDLLGRLRDWFAERGVTDERRMFGGVAFLADGRMAAAASSKGGLMLRCEPGETAALLEKPGVEPVVMRGREMRGWLHVSPEAIDGEADLESWLERALAHVQSLPTS